MKKLSLSLLIPSILVWNLHAAQAPDPKIYEYLNIDIKQDDDWVQKLNERGALAQPTRSLPKPDVVLPLVQKYPGLAKLPYVNICKKLPTPIQRLKNVVDTPGVELLVKCDNETAQPYGGNKARKFAFEVGRALAHGAKTIITFGCVASNHAVAVSEHSAQLGLKAICMLKPQPNSSVVRKNLLLHLTNGAQLHYYPDNNTRRIGTIEKWQDHKNVYGDYPYIIPTGGSTPTGTVGFVDAIYEMLKQGEVPDYIYVPCGSCATTAGLILGCKAAGIKTKVMAIATEPEDTPGEFKTNITKLFYATNTLLHETDPSFPLLELQPEDLNVNLDFTGEAYGLFTQEGIEARELLKKTEGILTDGTYTAKAAAAFLHDIRSHKVKGKILLWNTYDGYEFEERLKYVDYKMLPVCFHQYFEQDVQELDRLPAKL